MGIRAQVVRRLGGVREGLASAGRRRHREKLPDSIPWLKTPPSSFLQWGLSRTARR